jgi:NAD(P)H-hydrate epimerase
VNSLKDREVRIIRIVDVARAISEIKSILNQNYSLVIDGLFGIGLNRKLDDKYCELINLINEFKSGKLSVDVPSGLNAETGEIMGVLYRLMQLLRSAQSRKDCFARVWRGLLEDFMLLKKSV